MATNRDWKAALLDELGRETTEGQLARQVMAYARRTRFPILGCVANNEDLIRAGIQEAAIYTLKNPYDPERGNTRSWLFMHARRGLQEVVRFELSGGMKIGVDKRAAKQNIIGSLESHGCPSEDGWEIKPFAATRDNGCWVENKVDQTSHDKADANEMLAIAEAVCRAREYQCFVARYYEGRTLEEVGYSMNVSASRAQQMCKTAMEKVRRAAHIQEEASQ